MDDDNETWPPEGTPEGSAYHAGYEAGMNRFSRELQHALEDMTGGASSLLQGWVLLGLLMESLQARPELVKQLPAGLWRRVLNLMEQRWPR